MYMMDGKFIAAFRYKAHLWAQFEKASSLLLANYVAT